MPPQNDGERYALAADVGDVAAGDPVLLAEPLAFAASANEIARLDLTDRDRLWFLIDRRAALAAGGLAPSSSPDWRRDRKLTLVAEALAHHRYNVPWTPQPDLLELALIVRAAKVFLQAPTRPDDAWLPPNALRRLGALVEATLSERISLAGMSVALGLSSSAFSRAFRGSTGMTPGEYVVRCRLARAAHLLRFSEAPLTEVARQVGLGSATYLSHLFSTRVGVTPLRFRGAAGKILARADFE